MNTAQMRWYMEELKRKTRSLESDRQRVNYWLERAQDEPTKHRLKRELEDIGHRLGNVKARVAVLRRGAPNLWILPIRMRELFFRAARVA